MIEPGSAGCGQGICRQSRVQNNVAQLIWCDSGAFSVVFFCKEMDKMIFLCYYSYRWLFLMNIIMDGIYFANQTMSKDSHNKLM